MTDHTEMIPAGCHTGQTLIDCRIEKTLVGCHTGIDLAQGCLVGRTEIVLVGLRILAGHHTETGPVDSRNQKSAADRHIAFALAELHIGEKTVGLDHTIEQRIETLSSKAGIEGSSDEPKSFWKLSVYGNLTLVATSGRCDLRDP